MWHSYELGRPDVVDSKFVLNDEDVREALLGKAENCESIGGFRCAPHFISMINLQIDDREKKSKGSGLYFIVTIRRAMELTRVHLEITELIGSERVTPTKRSTPLFMWRRGK